MTILVFTATLLGAMALGLPIAFALLICGAALMVVQGQIDATILSQKLIEGADSFPLLAIPFFMLAGELMNSGGISKRIVNFALAWVGHLRGGLGFVAIFASVTMAAISGSAAADAAAIGALLIPMMRRAGYDVPRSAGLIAAGGIIAPVIPPSIGLIVFGVIANVSIGKLFLAGIFPGMMMGISLLVAWLWVARRDQVAVLPRQTMARAVMRQNADQSWQLSCTPDREGHIFANNDDASLFEYLAQIRLPLQIIASDPEVQGVSVSARACRWIAQHYGVRYLCIPDTTHFLQLERPNLCAQALREFVTSLRHADGRKPPPNDTFEQLL